MADDNENNFQLKQQLARMRMEYEQTTERYYKARNDLREHQRVLETLSQLNEDRTAYRIIGEVLAKQSVAEVKPFVSQTITQLDGIVKQMEQYLEKRQKDIEEFQIKNKIGA